jgi:muramoyltetrapeptide carboxypeptidase
MMKTIKPVKLKRGDKVGIISPSNSVVQRKEAFENAVALLEDDLELQIEIAPHAMGLHYYSSGTVQERLDDFHQMVIDPEIKAILFSLGGNTAIDLVDKLDYRLIQDNPKIITGLSDATTLLNAITAQTGIITYLGFELTDFGKYPMPYGLEMIKKMWFEGGKISYKPNSRWRNFDGLPTSYTGWEGLKAGKATGTLVGGNFTSFFQLINTPYQMGFDQSIVILETYKFTKRAIHQTLMKLRLHGIFKKINGLIIGYCLGSDNPEEYGDKRTMKDLVQEVTQGYDFPVMWVGEIGHKVENILVPLGARASIDADKLKFFVDEEV